MMIEQIHREDFEKWVHDGVTPVMLHKGFERLPEETTDQLMIANPNKITNIAITIEIERKYKSQERH